MLDKFLIGGYTSDNYTPNNQSEGIYVATLDTEQAKIVSIEPYVKLDNPAFFNFDPANDQHKLVTVLTQNENTGGVGVIDTTADAGKLIDTKMLDQNGVTPAYEAYDAATNRYFWNELSYTVPSYVFLDATRRIIFAANYNTNAVHTFKLDDQWHISEQHNYPIEGSGPEVEQDHAHIHFTRLLPDGRLIVCGLGCDKLFVYDVAENGELTLVTAFSTKPGFGPRQIAIAQKSNHIYVLGEVASRVAVAEYDHDTGRITWLNDYSNIPEGYVGHNGSAAIRLSADEQFLYVTNRGHNSLAVYRIFDDGRQLEKIQQIKTEGVFPRDFSLSKDNHFLLCANQNSNELILYRRDPESGFLSVAQRHIKHDACVRVLEATDFLG
ncbi:lactonase family protein [Lactiplantibacillus pentosus]|uniref:lactonase family protein n=1 Tax=Lactiplantibacillus pentosus TaxID=1589 RepID=UPI001330B1AC|nr:lactonase family protein [Lactiplantibacillus pentosus]MBQ0835259.1 lactonase family protein [Lactiplantibacillus pentosus]MBU7464864.1 lactonase family protein [Lactiplantibacillus pentosus]MBU7491289.1 lactonase family protein [Lactiplantibacillus pentosus]MBU7492511.1 lactonase family protein [Lactiplantibacillus pentosus]MBU7518429.1 lactonase family protein [Lactiplantibacillus pentosus]